MLQRVLKPVALNDLSRQTRALEGVLTAAAQRVLASGWYILGKECSAFEEEFGASCGVAHCVSVANGTDALELALRAVGAAPGGCVATVANAGGYSTAAIRALGAEPLYIDVEPTNLNMSAEDLAARLTPGVKAIVVTHLYGRMADMPALCAVASRAGIPVLEDCAQAHGASLDGRKAGSWGTIAGFSFYPTKNLGALGDGGAVVTGDDGLARRVRSLRQYGWTGKYRNAEYGRNSRMDELQAALLRVKLPHLDGWNRRRRQIASAYSEVLAGRANCPRDFGDDYVAHLYVLRSPQRDRVRAALQNLGVSTDIHYPVADHQQDAARGSAAAASALPVTEQAVREVFTLPCYAELEDGEVEAVCAALREVALG
jgi:dTDP-3-amino-2,3,6-trideoxy-4-keto-D-glucose/dTDP-3-amino-3,4,6-trideoxy-alpha-D-glucose/dTDP-2,6-dideoxy-D-kanosamine transaminase